MHDPVLIRIARGEAAAVGECIDEFGALVWGLARRLSPTRADAEDAVQEIFTDVWKSAARFDSVQGSEQMFIATIARRRLIDRLRRTAARPVFAGETAFEDAGHAEPGTRGEVSIEAERAAAAVGLLAPDQQRVIELAIVHGLTHSEIAARTGLPLGTVKTQIRRGIQKVRELLGVVVAGPEGGGA